nr:hypothetical protein [Sicyoidochytrium minutum DNA virus]
MRGIWMIKCMDLQRHIP